MNLNNLKSWFDQRVPRERAMLVTGAALLVAALVWAVALAPALRTLRSYDAQKRVLDTQVQAMQQLQAQAKLLQDQPQLSPTARTQALQASVQQAFGSAATVTASAGTVQLTLTNVSSQTLAQWLASARLQAHAAPQQAQLVRGPAGWSGTVQMNSVTP
jgi:general secretion pathway protein M